MEEIDIGDSGLISAKEAAKIMGTSTGYIWKLGYQGLLRTFRIGPTALYLRTEVEAYMIEHPRMGTRLTPR